MNGTRRKTSPAARKPACGPWSELANFVVTFESRRLRRGREERRITAHKMQEGGITATWIGAEQHPMCQWIAEHVGEGVPGVSQAADDVDPPRRGRARADMAAPVDAVARTPPAPLAIAIAQLRAVPVAAVASDDLPAGTKDLAAFDLEAMLDVRAEAGAAPGDAIEPHGPIEFYLRDMKTAGRSCLGRVARAERQNGDRYAATLRQVRLPPGTYRIDCATRTPGAEQPFVYLHGPVLQVA